MSSKFLAFNHSNNEFLIFGLTQQLSKLKNPTIHLPNNVILSSVDSDCYFGVSFEKNSFAQHISPVSKSYFHKLRENYS